MRARQSLALAALAVVLVGAAVGVVATGVFRSRGPVLTPAELAARAAAARLRRLASAEQKDANASLRLIAARLPKVPGSFEPAIPSQLFERPLPAHEVVGFIPYWTLPGVTPADVASATVLCFYGVSVNANGNLLTTGPEWANASATLQSPAFSDLVTEAHADGTKVLLTLASASDSVIGPLVSSPALTSARVAAQLVALVKAYGLDGVDIDIEGDRQADREGFVRFVGDLSRALRLADPSGEIILDAYAGSAGNPKDFFDVRHLAPDVDAIFIEGYDMNSAHFASATAPLATTDLGYSEVQTLIQYIALVPARKLILGLPFYGYDFTTRSDRPGAGLTSAVPEAVTYSAVAAVGRRAYWDPVAEAPYARFRLAGHWHETYYDDPLSLALKTALASEFHLAGVGAWALGMEGGDAQLLQALTGASPVVKLPAPTVGG